jgi:hypothetical protein
MPPKIDPTSTICITMQNTQYSLQFTNENYNYIQLTKNLKEIDTAIFTSISPNVNWQNPSHKVQFKYPFTRIYKQIHISAVSSNVGKLPITYLHRTSLGVLPSLLWIIGPPRYTRPDLTQGVMAHIRSLHYKVAMENTSQS